MMDDAPERIWLQMSNDGQHIRKWAREPFDGGVELARPVPDKTTREALEEAVKAIEAIRRFDWAGGDDWAVGHVDGKKDAIEAIHALIATPAPTGGRVQEPKVAALIAELEAMSERDRETVCATEDARRLKSLISRTRIDRARLAQHEVQHD